MYLLNKLKSLIQTSSNSVLLLLLLSNDALAVVNLGITSAGMIFVGFVYSIAFGLIPTYFIYRKYKNKKLWYLTPVIGFAVYLAGAVLFYLFFKIT